MRQRHILKAVMLMALMALVSVLVPSWETVLTRPIGQWQQVRVQPEVTPAPELAEPPAPLRVAAQPPTSSPVEEVAASAEEAPDLRAAAQPPASSPDAPATPQETAPDGQQDKSEASETEPVELAKREAELNELLTVGDELVRAGVRLPQLVARWRVADIEALVAKGLGMVVAETDRRFYRVIAGGGAVVAAQDFRLLRSQERETLSNRSVHLNREQLAGGWCDTPVRPVFAQLEQRLQAHAPSQMPPVLMFFPTGAFDAYLARKQLGALAQVGLDLHQPGFDNTQAATIGTIVMSHRRPVYLIHQVRYGTEVWTWDDPEAALVEKV